MGEQSFPESVCLRFFHAIFAIDKVRLLFQPLKESLRSPGSDNPLGTLLNCVHVYTQNLLYTRDFHLNLGCVRSIGRLWHDGRYVAEVMLLRSLGGAVVGYDFAHLL